jgi:16S rRNA (uracil1498-N3)-methyltransferase
VAGRSLRRSRVPDGPRIVRLRRLFLDAPLAAGTLVRLDERAANHLVRVLRMKVGDELRVFDGGGGEHAATIRLIAGTRVELAIGAAHAPTPESPLAITLTQGVSRGERMDYALQKATELGVARIAPVLCERSVVRLDAGQAASRHEHWQGVVSAAAAQCGRATLPELLPPRQLALHLAATPAASAGQRAMLSPDATFGLAALPRDLGAIELLIGPEGGLSDEEQRLAVGRGYRPLKLGPRVLRTETAAAAAVAALQALYGDLG